MQNGIQEADSSVKKVVKRSRQILDSDDDEEPIAKEQVARKSQGDKAVSPKKEKVKPCLQFLILLYECNSYSP